jgi:alginate O-acetyltransferase complex protein AlgI
MSLVGLWHGAAWTYILWGVYHGVMLNIYAWAGRRTRISAKASMLSHTFFTLILLVGWALFLSPDLAFAQNLLANMFGLQGIGNGNNMRALLFGAPLLSTVFIAALLAFSGIAEAAYLSQVRRPAHMFALGIIVILCLLKMGTVRQFVYVQF